MQESICESPQPANTVKIRVVADKRLRIITAEGGDPVVVFPKTLPKADQVAVYGSRRKGQFQEDIFHYEKSVQERSSGMITREDDGEFCNLDHRSAHGLIPVSGHERSR